jgi:hypothetical protein
VDQFFQRLARLASSKEFSLATLETNSGGGSRGGGISERENKTLAKLASWF